MTHYKHDRKSHEPITNIPVLKPWEDPNPSAIRVGQQVTENKTVLYCTVLYCTVLYCTVLYCTVLYCTVLYCTVLYCTVLYCTVLYCTALHCTVLYCTVLYKLISLYWELFAETDYLTKCEESYKFQGKYFRLHQ